MREMKDSGVEWIGEIPRDWESIKNKYLLSNMYSGGTPSATNTEYYSDNGVPFVSISDMSTKDFVEETKKYITDSGLKDKNLKILPVGTILYSIYATVGAISELKIEATISQAMLALTLNNKISKNFYKYNLSAMREFIFSDTNGNTQFNLNAEKVNNFYFAYPPLETQHRIADYLDRKCSKIDEIIEKESLVIEKLKAYKLSVITEAVTKGLNPDVPMKDSGIEWIGKVPSSWDSVKLKYCTYIRARLGWKGLKADEYIESGYPLLSAFNIVNNKLDFSNLNFINQERYDESPEIKLSINDVLLVKDGAGIGKCGIVRELPFESTVNGSIAVVTANDILNGTFLYYYFLTNMFQKFIDRVKGGMGVPHLFQSDLKEISIPLPSLIDQHEIITYLDLKCTQIDETITKKQATIEKLTAYKKSLIYEVVTGKKEV